MSICLSLNYYVLRFSFYCYSIIIILSVFFFFFTSVCLLFLSFFFFKQKTAYEMRISDWSSDVCSSDLDDDELRELLPSLRRFALWLARDPADADDLVQACMERALSRWSTRRGDGSLKARLFAIAHRQFIDQRRSSEERRVGKECVRTRRSRWSPYN